MVERNAQGRIVADYGALIPEEFDLAVAEQAVVYLPMGSIEWHNNHLPFNTDSLIAEGLCRRLAAETGGLILPANPWATACTFNKGGPYPFDRAAGTIALFDADLHHRLLSRIARGVTDNGFRRLVMMAGHVGRDDRESMERVADEVNALGEAKAIFVYPYRHTKGDHAGHFETLMLLGLDAEQVRAGKTYVPFAHGHPLDGTETPEAGRQKIDQVVAALLESVRREFGLK